MPAYCAKTLTIIKEKAFSLMSIRDEGKANKVSNTERKYTMKSNLLKKK